MHRMSVRDRCCTLAKVTPDSGAPVNISAATTPSRRSKLMRKPVNTRARCGNDQPSPASSSRQLQYPVTSVLCGLTSRERGVEQGPHRHMAK